MSKPVEPRRARIDGEDVVLLPKGDYERLAMSRRQLGAREARLRGVRSQVRDLTQVLTHIEQLLTDAAPCCDARRDVETQILQLIRDTIASAAGVTTTN